MPAPPCCTVFGCRTLSDSLVPFGFVINRGDTLSTLAVLLPGGGGRRAQAEDARTIVT